VEDCERLVARQGWAVEERYVDDDVSAYSGKPRPAYRRMLDDLRGGFLDAVVVWDLDRLHRQPRELEEFFDLCKLAGVSKLASVSGDVDLSTHDGQFLARILGAVAELAHAGKIAGGGSRAFGYESDKRSVRESEALVIRECAARLLAGEALRSICGDLNERGVQTVMGAEWKPQTLRRILLSARISGQREHHKEIVATAEWPPIITPAESTRIRGLLSDPERRTNRVARRYLLVRLLRCGLCGETLVSRPKAGGARAYVCAKGPGFSGCGRITVMAEPLEQFVVDAVLYRLDSPELAAAMRGEPGDPDAQRWQAEIEQSRAELDELAAMYGRREIGLSEWQAARTPIERRVTDAKKQLGRLTRTSALAGQIGHAAELRERWTSLSLSRQHAIVAAVLDHVVVAPGRRGYNKFDVGRFTPAWRA
jgi:site-specific DNA recombinase